MSKYPDIQTYPSTLTVYGKQTIDEQTEYVARLVYDYCICDLRCRVEDIPKLLEIAIELRKSV